MRDNLRSNDDTNPCGGFNSFFAGMFPCFVV